MSPERYSPREEDVVVKPYTLEEKFSRSGGKGGQNVNTRETAVELAVTFTDPDLLAKMRRRFPGYFSKEGVMRVRVTQERTQGQNRAIAEKQLEEMIREASVEQKERISTKPKRSAKEKRLQGKRRRGDIKESRKRPEW